MFHIENNVLCGVRNTYNARGTITIPNSITEIDDYAFENCRYMSEIIIPDGVIFIGKWAFCNCANLTEVIISNSVIEI